jgi:hypothetical protein
MHAAGCAKRSSINRSKALWSFKPTVGRRTQCFAAVELHSLPQHRYGGIPVAIEPRFLPNGVGSLAVSFESTFHSTDPVSLNTTEVQAISHALVELGFETQIVISDHEQNGILHLVHCHSKRSYRCF